ncbi:TonB-dependent receptor plug domain-containing protein [Pseudotamlana agarivorans]|uniref:TonB-dependent receptor plug domain-containing protein n=1 Tax=Pseudotamlana agarivorans TaxID=481183 RepID=UPI00082D2CC9|nr:TonB-dependent receptor [Tamlana agarivorans]
MSLNKNNIIIFFSIIFSAYSFSQEVAKDSTKLEELDEVVITGQYNPQSVDKSIFEVKVINRKEIEQRAAINLSDLLNQTLNINIIPNASTGKTGVSLFGLDAQYFKILIDNVPIINEEGVGNNVDLTLINLDDTQSVEIIEGAMGVQYGANAVSGVINIITKKSIREKTRIQVYAQEETVGDEYEWFDKGRHIQSLNLSHNFTEDIFGSAVYTRNDFAGVWGDKQGEVYDKNDGLRGHEWLPKLQNNAKILLNYKKGQFNIFYKFDYFNEVINEYNSTVDPNENTATDTSDPLALDQTFFNNRFIHHLNSNGLLGKHVNYNISVSYQEQVKDLETYTYRIREDEKLNIQRGEYLSRQAFFSRGTFSNLIQTNQFNLQAGYELTNESGYGSPLAITVNTDENEAKQRLDNYDFFASSEIELSERFSLRPGARVSFTNLFDDQYVFSLSSKYLFNKGIELRGVLGSSNRTPNYDELYTYFVDVNHNVQGNPDLNPENGLSAFLHLKKITALSNNSRLKNKITASYLSVQDRIELTIVEQSPLSYQYQNIDSYKAIGITSENTYQINRLNVRLGASVLGISKILDSHATPLDDFLYSFQINSTINYLIPKWNASAALYFKHTGRQHQFVERTNDQGDQEFQKGTTEAYDWLDATFKKSFLDKKLETTLGVKNLFDISSIETDAFSGGAHDAAPEFIPLAYGRSFFLKLAYNLNL